MRQGIFQQYCSPTDHTSFAHFYMIRERHSGSEPAIFTNDASPGHRDTRSDIAVLFNNHTMPDVDIIGNTGTRTDDSIFQHPPVDRHLATDMHVVAD